MLSSSTRVPVSIDTASFETMERDEDPFESEDVECKMDHEVERVLREWDSNKQRITHNSIRLRPTPTPTSVSHNLLSVSMPSSPSQQRRKRFSNSMSNLSFKGVSSPAPTTTPERRHFDFPEINVTRREDSRLSSNSFEVLNEDVKAPLYVNCPKSGQRMFKMEFDTEGYPHESISVRVTGDKLVIHATQNESVEGRVSTTEFCRKVKLPRDVNSKRLECHVNPTTGMLIVTAPIRSPPTSTTSSFSPHSPGTSHKQEVLNVPFIRNSAVGKMLYLNAEVGSVFQSDDVTVKVIGQNKLLITAQRQEDKNGNTLNASLTREFLLLDKIVPKTIQAGLSTDGVLKLAALLDCEERKPATNGKVHIELDSENAPQDIKLSHTSTTK